MFCELLLVNKIDIVLDALVLRFQGDGIHEFSPATSFLRFIKDQLVIEAEIGAFEHFSRG